MIEKFSNRLIHESSPYLLQHAHNPVQWYPWGEEALQAARAADKPILVSIGYAACHWCHVMERESFEDEAVAAIMNEHFINIKIDREERPDLDHIYMEAVQAIAGNGGWPLNVFLTTEAKPFYGGTYYPPQRAFNRPSWKEVLINISEAWKSRRQELLTQSETLLAHINNTGNFISSSTVFKSLEETGIFNNAVCDTIAANILKTADKASGGFGKAPKFPQTFTIQYLLAYGHFFQQEESSQQAIFSLKQMLNGGINDQLAGGLARYSTDGEWLAPHFEKMLYDNALLVNVLTDAYQLTADEQFVQAIDETLAFFLRDMKHEAGGFYAALDADSEGEEGKFYVWQRTEIETILGEDANWYCEYYGLLENGNWEGKNILHISHPMEEVAKKFGFETEVLKNKLTACNARLLQVRNNRPHPQKDDKILLGWNALLLTAFCKAAAALGKEVYKNEAIILFDFIQKNFTQDGIIKFHTYKNGQAKNPAFLDDYAYMIQACIHLQEITSDQQYLFEAKKLTEFVIDHFENEETGFFFFTSNKQTDIVIRKSEFYDSALPSGNSIMAGNLLYLAIVFDLPGWQKKALNMLGKMLDIVQQYPGSFAIWAKLLLHQVIGTDEIVVTGMDLAPIREEIVKRFIPNKIFQSTDNEVQGLPLLTGKSFNTMPFIYLCRNNSCNEPVRTVNQLDLLLKKPFY